MKTYLKKLLVCVVTLSATLSSAVAQSDPNLNLTNQQESTPGVALFQQSPQSSRAPEGPAWKSEADLNATSESLQKIDNEASTLQLRIETLNQEAPNMPLDELEKKYSEFLNDSENLAKKMQENELTREQGIALQKNIQEARAEKELKIRRHPVASAIIKKYIQVALTVWIIKTIKNKLQTYRIKNAWVNATPEERAQFLALSSREQRQIVKDIATGKHKKSKALNDSVANFKEKRSTMTDKERSEALESILNKAQTLANESGDQKLLQAIKDARAKENVNAEAVLALAGQASGAAAWRSSMDRVIAKQQNKALAGQYTAASQLEKEIAAFNENASKMSQAELEAKMEQILTLAQGISDKIKNYPDSEQQRALLKKTIIAAQNTLDGIRNGSITGNNIPDTAKNAIRKLRGPIGHIRTTIASRLRNGNTIKALLAYIRSLRNPDNSQISPEA